MKEKLMALEKEDLLEMLMNCQIHNMIEYRQKMDLIKACQENRIDTEEILNKSNELRKRLYR
jgi:hypothetical protein